MPKLKRAGDADNRGGTDFIESLDRGLRVLEVFGGSRQPMTLSDLAKAADLPRATARRILFTLERAGFVATDGKLFRLMPRVLVLASSYLASNHVVSVLQPALDRLSAEAQEISSMAILDGNDVVFIARASPTRIFSAGIDIGYRLPAFCTSVGRVLLSRLPDDELAAALDKMDLVPLTPFTVTDKKLLQKTIIADRAKGYSLVDREAEPGFRSISVPIRRYDGASSPPSTWARMSTACHRPRWSNASCRACVRRRPRSSRCWCDGSVTISTVIASAAKQSIVPQAPKWIASLRSHDGDGASVLSGFRRRARSGARFPARSLPPHSSRYPA